MSEVKPLKVTKVCYLEVEYREIGRFICQVYGLDYYNPVAAEEWRNDSQYRIMVNKEELQKWDLEILEKAKAGRAPCGSLCVFMTDMCNRGLIEPGEYLIDVCW